MAGLYVTDRQSHGATVVSNRFVDEYMAEANGEFVKVYLLLLRQMTHGGELSVAGMADRLNNTEADVLRALKYWEKTGLIRLEYDRAGTLAGILLLDGDEILQTPGRENRQGIEDVSGQIPGRENRRRTGFSVEHPDGWAEAGAAEQEAAAKSVFDGGGPTKEQMQTLAKDADFTQLVYMAGRYTGKNLTARDCDVLGNLYGNLHMSAELLEYLLEYCVSNGHRSMRYIEAVALNWKERGILTVEQARAETVMGGKNTYAVLKAFGLGGRNPAAGERKTIDRWFREYGFPVEVVLEACDRTMRTIHQPSFEYADKILTEWRKKGISRKEDIARLDEKQPKAQAQIQSRDEKRPNSFHNFTQRDYDYDELVKKLNGF